MDFPALQLDWDDWNREHITKHSMSISEVESVLVNDSITRPSYKNRLIVIGPSDNDRMIAVVIGPSPHAENLWYVFSARPASRRERAQYRREKDATP
jgi:uncharacterized DUF497 family protein